MTRLTKEQAAIIGAYTGVTCGPFSDIHEYAEKILGRPIWTHQFGDETFMATLRDTVRPDFIAPAYEAPDGQ